MKLKSDQICRNVTTGFEVRVESITISKAWESRIVEYFNLEKLEHFIKPLYVFQKTYRILN